MKRIYQHTETIFEKLTAVASAVLGNSITFIVAFLLVIFWLLNDRKSPFDFNEYVRDAMNGVVFLTLFIIQKAFNRFSASMHLKINELVASNKLARNAMINVEIKTEKEMTELSKEFTELAELAQEKEAAKA